MEHAAIGNTFRRKVKEVGVFRTVIHMNLAGPALSPNSRDAFVPFCLEAGRLASSWSEFGLADRLFHLGIESVEPRHRWKPAQATRFVELYRHAAEMAIELNRYDVMYALTEEALDHSKDPAQRLKISQVQVRGLVTQGNYSEAIQAGTKVLHKAMNEPVLRITPKMIDSEIKSMRKALEGVTKDDLLNNSPPVMDKKWIGTMEMMNQLVAPALVTQGDLTIVLACRMAKATLKYGLTPASPFAFSLLGVIFSSMEDDLKLGNWCSKRALELAEKGSQHAVMSGRVSTVHWGLQGLYSTTWKDCQEPLKIAYRVCIKEGDVEVRLDPEDASEALT